ncbi:hypothetical protein [Alicyclobacillus dauci]|uniref:Uncharacterized protein n=1 Tax=Alicyclobacillus dauci TaxID=1475485 RepID=A0ABY6Z3K4_9BACL|nr:hypothetical protein [Alicyclobacillus dauci]WAH37463.1 hypothetical protein NZD86_02680 [Alicyclobacillus dauci]
MADRLGNGISSLMMEFKEASDAPLLLGSFRSFHQIGMVSFVSGVLAVLLIVTVTSKHQTLSD